MRTRVASVAALMALIGIGILVIAEGTDVDAPGVVEADAAIVLSGDVDYLRVKHASALFKAGQVKALLLTGHGVGGDSAEAMRTEAMAAGVPAQAIVLETTSTSTRENLVFAARIVRARGWRRVALVTSRSHLARALATARKTMPEIEWVAASVPDAGSPDRARRLRVEEALKLMWYRARGWA